jgi:hypothetical protein
MRRWHLAFGVLAIAGLVLGLTGSVGAQGGDSALFSVLTGGKEVDSTGERGTGDGNGRGSFSATLDGRMLCYGIQVKKHQQAGGLAHPPGRVERRGPGRTGARTPGQRRSGQLERVRAPLTQPCAPAQGEPGALLCERAHA